MQRAEKGLAGLIVADTAISDVQSEGRLIYRGHSIDELVQWRFEQVAGLLLDGPEDTDLGSLLAELSNLEDYETQAVLNLPADLHPMKMLQSLVPVLAPPPRPLGFGEVDQGIVVCARLPALVLTHLRREPVKLDASVGYAERFLQGLDGQSDPRLAQALNVTQILQLEHSLNAGTFAARVVASTLAPVEAAQAAGLGALSGPLHGGADQAAMDIVDTLRDVEQARTYVDELLATGGKLPGMGHREYRVRDPRAEFLQVWARELSQGTGHAREYDILCALDEQFRAHMARAGKPLYANVEFYKGLVYRMIGLPNHFFTAGFAMARVFGYVAHFAESRLDNRIFRPAAVYTGPQPD